MRSPWYEVSVKRSLVLAAVLLGGACSRGPGSVHVASVRVVAASLAEPLREAGLDEAALQAAAREALQAAGFRAGDGSRPHRAEVAVAGVRLVPPESPGAPVRVEISIEVALAPAEPGKGGAVRELGTAAVPLSGGDPGTTWKAAVQGAMRQAADGLALAFAAEAKSSEKLIADLRAEDVHVRDHAVRVLADRKSRAAVPALIERLSDDDQRVVHRAVGALAQIGDERAAGPLIELSRSGDSGLTARVARIIGDIGGAEAEGYLLTIEAGHPDPRVRGAAREALAELRARAGGTGAVAARK
jgi:hypothetical protein